MLPSLLREFVLNPHVFNNFKYSDCLSKFFGSTTAKAYAINFNGIFFVLFESFCLSEQPAAFLGFANLSFKLSKSLFVIKTSPLISISVGKLFDLIVFGISKIVFKFSIIYFFIYI